MPISNNPPYAVLELDKEEVEYLNKLFELGLKQADKAFRDVCSMPSTDERANNRSILIMAATFDITMYEGLIEKLNLKEK